MQLSCGHVAVCVAWMSVGSIFFGSIVLLWMELVCCILSCGPPSESNPIRSLPSEHYSFILLIPHWQNGMWRGERNRFDLLDVIRRERRGRAAKAPSVSPQPCSPNENQCVAPLKRSQRTDAMVDNEHAREQTQIGMKKKCSWINALNSSCDIQLLSSWSHRSRAKLKSMRWTFHSGSFPFLWNALTAECGVPLICVDSHNQLVDLATLKDSLWIFDWPRRARCHCAPWEFNVPNPDHHQHHLR